MRVVVVYGFDASISALWMGAQALEASAIDRSPQILTGSTLFKSRMRA